MATTNFVDLYVADLHTRGCTDATIAGYHKNLTRADRELPEGLRDANCAELKAWIHRKGLAPASRKAYDSALRGYFNWRQREGLLEFNPMSQLKAPKVPEGLPRVASDDQVRWAMQTPQPLRLWAVLASYGGLRCIEISRLRREHVGVRATMVPRGKGDRPRRVPTHPLVWAAVADLPPGPVTDLSAKQISLRFLRYARRHGLAEMSLHRCRGWFCSTGYRACHDLVAMQRSMGHAKPGQTVRYIDLTDDQIRAVIDGLPTFD
jgi:integrase/recombinase XerC